MIEYEYVWKPIESQMYFYDDEFHWNYENFDWSELQIGDIVIFRYGTPISWFRPNQVKKNLIPPSS